MAQSLPYAVSCKGGLNKNLNQFEMLAHPGIATTLENFEVETMLQDLMVQMLL